MTEPIRLVLLMHVAVPVMFRSQATAFSITGVCSTALLPLRSEYKETEELARQLHGNPHPWPILGLVSMRSSCAMPRVGINKRHKGPVVLLIKPVITFSWRL